MMRFVHSVTRFVREESGSATVDFVLVVTFFAAVMGASFEIGIMNLRHAMLERGLDTAVRDIRLSTGDIPTFAETKTKICEEAYLLPDCENNLHLEMAVVDPRLFSPLADSVNCTNAAETAKPVVRFENGVDNQLMLLRACFSFKPMFPTTGIGSEITKDENGYAKFVSTSAFVQEPR